MFRESYRRRSTITWSVWGGAFVVLALFLAWRLEWLPGSGSGGPVEEETTADNNVTATDDTKPPEVRPAEPVDPTVFNQQGEPGDGFPEPARFRGGSDAKPLTPASPLKGDNNVAGKSGIPSFLDNYPKKSTGIRRAGFTAPRPADDETPPATLLSQIDRLIQNREYLSAHRKLSEIYWNKPKWRKATKSRIEMTAEEIYFRPNYHAMRAYTVQYGDQLQTIARKYGVHWHYLARLNELRITKTRNGQESVNIRPGQKLKVIKGYDFAKKRPLFGVSIDLSDRELTLYHARFFVRKYRIGIGKKKKRSPIGNFTVQDKVIDPPYTGTDERTGRRIQIAGKDPRNPLGTHWLRITNEYGIHGTNNPNSIGKAQSRGCIRMLNADVKEVYGFLAVGSHVEIKP